jgi:hypothetical protein
MGEYAILGPVEEPGFNVLSQSSWVVAIVDSKHLLSVLNTSA